MDAEGVGDLEDGAEARITLVALDAAVVRTVYPALERERLLGNGWGGSLYLATRHFAGWYMVNVLDLRSEDVAIALGHTDGGELVRPLYGHRDHERALDRVTAAYERTVSLTQMRLV